MACKLYLNTTRKCRQRVCMFFSLDSFSGNLSDWETTQQTLTSGSPKPALAQLTDDSCSFSTSATGLAMLVGGKTGPWQVGHWYPAGAVWRGSRDAKLLRHDQWKTSVGNKINSFTLQEPAQGLIYLSYEHNKQNSINLHCSAYNQLLTWTGKETLISP